MSQKIIKYTTGLLRSLNLKSGTISNDLIKHVNLLTINAKRSAHRCFRRGTRAGVHVKNMQSRIPLITRPNLIDLGATSSERKRSNTGMMILKDLNTERQSGKGRGKSKWDTNSGIHYDLLRPLKKTEYILDNTKHMSLCLVNAQSVVNKMDILLHFLTTEGLDICAVTETWVRDVNVGIIKASAGRAGFRIIQASRKSRQGGGLAVLVKKSVNLKLIESGELDSFEYLLVSARHESSLFHMALIYRPPYSENHRVTTEKFFEEFPEFISNTLSKYSQIILLGDFNIHINCESDACSQRFTSIMNSFNLKQHVTIPTHKSGNTLDFIITKAESSLTLTAPRSEDFLSDHCFITSVLNFVKPTLQKKEIEFRSIKKLDAEKFAKDTENLVMLLNDIKDLQELSDSLDEGLRKILDKHAPVKRRSITVRDKVPWFDETASNLKSQKRASERRWRKDPSDQNWTMYKKVKTDYNHYLKSQKETYVNDEIKACEGDTRKLFSIVNSFTGVSVENPLPEASSDKALTDGFAKYFLNKIETIRKSFDQVTPFEPVPVNCETFQAFTAVTEEEVRTLISSAKSTTCLSDVWPTTLLKRFLPVLLPLITKLVNMSLSDGIFLTKWKKAMVKPLIKKANLDHVYVNYRPVSNLSFISKITERVVNNQFQCHIQKNSLLPDYQSSYRTNYSTETTLLRLTDDIWQSMEQGQVTAMVALDLSAAFDTVNHEILCNVLQNRFGITNTALKWTKEYLKDRCFQVQIRNALSEPVYINYSVPQGSILGPVFFNCYAATLDDYTHDREASLSGYADDHALIYSFKPGADSETKTVASLEQTISQVREWMRVNHLKMNDKKTEYIVFGGKQQRQKCVHSSLHVGDDDVPASDTIKYLGATLDEQLSFKKHIEVKCLVASRNIYRIMKLKRYLSEASMKTLMSALVLSHFDYLNSLFTGLPDCTIQPMQRLQNTAAKVATGARKFDSATNARFKLHWLPIRQRCIYKTLVITYKALHSMAPDYLANRLVSRTYSKDTRASSVDVCTLVSTVNKRKTFADRGFTTLAPEQWNKLPVPIRNCDSLESFKKALKTYLFQGAYNC